MPPWLQITLAIISGGFAIIGIGFGVKLLEFLGVKEAGKIKMRDELWAEIGSLRTRIEHLEQENKELRAGQSVNLQNILSLRIAKHELLSLSNAYRLRLHEAMLAVNKRDDELHHAHTYDIAAVELHLTEEAEKAKSEALKAIHDNIIVEEDAEVFTGVVKTMAVADTRTP